ncbi:hypothetical protein PGTUg99_005814 [Puccinia graminis f. sp. tritici]|uniref:Uncharacterized protein n=1 Tax=Puccinia graminis f. sp. tritici TaxID=56615 RepID=A0A5B0S397_PUCGR|nr:hypothetical protein PGTUg99_005814 [Puccinia graminis f. sp. tritici]
MEHLQIMEIQVEEEDRNTTSKTSTKLLDLTSKQPQSRRVTTVDGYKHIPSCSRYAYIHLLSSRNG